MRDLIETIATVIGDGALARVDFGAVPLRPNDLSDMFADTTAARSLLGYEAAVALEDGLSRTVAWHRTARGAVTR
jgi:nucleoside-diphosphate-sugar epimerase